MLDVGKIKSGILFCIIPTTVNFKWSWATDFVQCVFQLVVVVNIKMPYWYRHCAHFWPLRLDLNWPANDDVTNGEMSVHRWNSVAVHLASHRVVNVNVNVVMIVSRSHCVMYLHCYHMCAVAVSMNGSVDFVSRPMIVLEVVDRYWANAPDALVLWLANMQSNYFCIEEEKKKIQVKNKRI